MNMILKLVAVATVILSITNEISCQDTSGDVAILTEEQKKGLDMLKAAVYDKLPHEYMKRDLYMLRYLIAKEFVVKDAEELILENVKWREENKMDTIIDEDFADMEEDYKIDYTSVDLAGRPVIVGNVGDWDIRKAVVAGKLERLERYSDRASEIIYRKVLKLQEEGQKNVTQFSFLVNMNNYNNHQHGCTQCLPFYIYLTESYEQHYPGTAHLILLMNTPPTFEIVLDAIRPLMSPPTREALKVYNQDKTHWGPILDAYMSPDHVPDHLGGKKKT